MEGAEDTRRIGKTGLFSDRESLYFCHPMSRSSKTRGISLQELIAVAYNEHAELPADAVPHVSTSVYARYVAWCQNQPQWKGRSAESGRQERLIRNRESARNSRLRDKEREEAQRATLARLMAENVQLRAELELLKSVTCAEPRSDDAAESIICEPSVDGMVCGPSGEFITFLPPEGMVHK